MSARPHPRRAQLRKTSRIWSWHSACNTQGTMLKTSEIPDSHFSSRDYLYGMLALLGLVLSQWAL